MRKFFLVLLTAVCLACAGLAVACNGEKNYYSLTFVTEANSGVTVKSNVPPDSSVLEGYTVSFTLLIEDDTAGGPVVKVNDELIEADGEGFYAFAIKQDTVVSVTGVYLLSEYTVTFDRGDGELLRYLDRDGNELEGDFSLKLWDEISFSVLPSVYCRDSVFTVKANNEVLSPDADGIYTYAVKGTTTITVTGVEEDLPFFSREDGGSGTMNDPYRISKPIDLYAIAYMIDSSFYQQSYYAAYYRMEADIDLEGERLYIIGTGGDEASGVSAFAGNFDGGGHTISNYYISDTIIEQTGFVEYFIPSIGLFGYAFGAEIYDLNLENFTIDVDGAEYNEAFFVGGIVGIGIGVSITNCSVRGTITADAASDYSKLGYVGGIIGYQQSYGDGASARYYSVVRSCSAEVDISCDSGYVFAAGGISGYTNTVDEKTAAVVLNCISSGEITGSMHTGGITGYLGPYCSVKGSYATGIVSAENRDGVWTGYETIAYAYGGGIVGYADYGTVVSDCFFVGTTYAYASNDKYGVDGGIVAGRSEGSVVSPAAVVLNCYSGQKNYDDSFIKNTLGWSEADWSFRGNGLPSINRDLSEKRFTVTIVFVGQTVGGAQSLVSVIENSYIPMSYWYIVADSEIVEYLQSDDGRMSYGYFFDEACTQKVPDAYVPTDDITIYAAFEDYGKVAGTYYLKTGDRGEKILILDADGVLTYREGALSFVSDYTYDGTTLIFRDTYLAMLNGVSEDGTVTYTTFKAVVGEDGRMKIYDDEIYLESAPLEAVKRIDGFRYATYSGEGVSYTFYGDGTGVDATGKAFTYAVSGNSIVLVAGDVTYTGTIADGVVKTLNGVTLSVKDVYEGVWEKSAGSYSRYVFDGEGNWTRTTVNGTEYGGYRYNADGSITLDNGVTASLADEFLVLDGITYYRPDSYVGTWRFFSIIEPLELTLDGIGVSGYGTGTVDYGLISGQYAIDYQAVTDGEGNTVIQLYFLDVVFGELTYSAENGTLTGTVYSMIYGNLVSATFCRYDLLRGDWTSEAGAPVSGAVFNGFGGYDIKGTFDTTPVKSSVSINGDAGEAKTTYTLEDGTAGSFVYGDTQYSFVYDEENDVILVTYDGGSFLLERSKTAA